MGIWALTQFCNESKEASQFVNLTDLSAQQVAGGEAGLTLIVDGFGFFYTLFEKACPGWEWVSGGNYPHQAAELESYVLQLRHAGVEICVVLDPAQGTASEEVMLPVQIPLSDNADVACDDKVVVSRQPNHDKDAELHRRFVQRCETIGGAMELLHSGKNLYPSGGDKCKMDWQMPPLSTEQAIRTLRKLGVRMLTCEQEADAQLPSILQQTPGAYAVTGQDSDFFIMAGIRYIPLEHLRIEGVGPATQVTGRVYTRDSVAAALRLPVERMHELAWLVGNDLSAHLLDAHRVPELLGIPTVATKTKGCRSRPKDVASFLSQLPPREPLASHPVMAQILAGDCSRELQDSLSKCATFYSGIDPSAHETELPGGKGAEMLDACGGILDYSDLILSASRGETPLERLLCKGLRETTLPTWSLAVYRNRVYTNRVKVEEMAPERESAIDAALRPVRSALYALITPRPPQSVTPPPPPLPHRDACITQGAPPPNGKGGGANSRDLAHTCGDSFHVPEICPREDQGDLLATLQALPARSSVDGASPSIEQPGLEAEHAVRNGDEDDPANTQVAKVKQGKAHGRPLPSNYKTRLCLKWQQHGECSFASHCNFAHGHEELRTACSTAEASAAAANSSSASGSKGPYSPLTATCHATPRLVCESSVTVTESVRVGHDLLQVEVEALRPEVVEWALGSSDLVLLRGANSHRRIEMLHVLLHLATLNTSDVRTSANARAFSRRIYSINHDSKRSEETMSRSPESNILAGDTEFSSHDPLILVPDKAKMPDARGRKGLEEVPYRVIGVIFRVMYLLSRFAENVDKGGGGGGQVQHPLKLGVGEYEALVQLIVLLNSGYGMRALPPLTPSPQTVQVASFFLATVSAVNAAAQLLDVEFWIPEPAQLFSGRLFTHLHARTPQARELLASMPSFDTLFGQKSQLFNAVFSIFGDLDWLLPSDHHGEAIMVRSSCSRSDSEAGMARNCWQENDTTIRNGVAERETAGRVLQQERTDASKKCVDAGLPEIMPIQEHRDMLLQNIRNYQITCIQGETGCGKSSMVPQFILEDCQMRGQRVNIIVTQPRRIAALTLSRRVADQRKVKLGTSVGYRVGQGDHMDSRKCLIKFVTVGYLLQYLAHNPDKFDLYTHIVLDEVHERSMDMDLLNLVIKKLLDKQYTRCGAQKSTKIVVMSATLQSGLFGEYFTRQNEMVSPSIFVGARRFAVRKVYFEDILEEIPSIKKMVGSTVCKLLKTFETSVESYKTKTKGNPHIKAEISPETRKVICAVVRALAQPASCILVFLPGIGEIGEMQDDLEMQDSKVPPGVPLEVLILHSLVPKEEQELVMNPAKMGHCKIILSTNIAESSITIPDVRVVLDSGLQRVVYYDGKRGMSSLIRTWCSKSSGKQRAGRAGRVAPGTIFYLYTRAFHDEVMPEFDEAEMKRVSLEKTVLQVKSLLSGFGTTTELLSQALTAPSPERVRVAIKMLYEVGAITSDAEDAEVTQLGRLATHLPIDLCLVKMILLGIFFECAPEVIVMAAASSLEDVFLKPSRIFCRDHCTYVKDMSHNFLQRTKYDNGCFSEPLAYFAAYRDWLLSDKKPHTSSKLGLSSSRMTQLDMLTADLCRKVQRFLSDGNLEQARLESLLRVSQRRGPCKTLEEKREVRLLSCNDVNRLRFIIAGACAPIFLEGKVNEKDSKDLALSGLSKSRTLIMRKLSKEAESEQTLTAALTAVSVHPSVIHKSNRNVFVEIASDHLPSGTFDGGKVNTSASLVEDIAFGCKLLLQLKKSDLVLPNPNFRPGSGEADTLTIGGVSMDRKITWHLSKDESAASVRPSTRSPLSNMCDFSGTTCHLAAAQSVLALENSVFAVGMTVLPFNNVLRLIFTPPGQTLKLLCNAEKIVAMKVGNSKITFSPVVLMIQDLVLINRIRKAVSIAIVGGVACADQDLCTSKSMEQGDVTGGGRKIYGPQESVETMLTHLMHLLLRKGNQERPNTTDLTKEKSQDVKSEDMSDVILGGGDIMLPNEASRSKDLWVSCVKDAKSLDYLPQLRLDTMVELSTPDHYDFTTGPVGRVEHMNSFVFTVKAANDAYIALHDGLGPAHDARKWEIVLGGWGGSCSVIRCGSGKLFSIHQGRVLESGGPFWVSWTPTACTVGQGGVVGKDVLMSATRPDSLLVKELAVATGRGAKGHWSFNLEPEGGGPRDSRYITKDTAPLDLAATTLTGDERGSATGKSTDIQISHECVDADLNTWVELWTSRAQKGPNVTSTQIGIEMKKREKAGKVPIGLTKKLMLRLRGDPRLTFVPNSDNSNCGTFLSSTDSKMLNELIAAAAAAAINEREAINETNFVELVVGILQRNNGKVLASSCCNELYTLNRNYKPFIKAQGLKKICSRHSEKMQFVDEGGCQVLRLARGGRGGGGGGGGVSGNGAAFPPVTSAGAACGAAAAAVATEVTSAAAAVPPPPPPLRQVDCRVPSGVAAVAVAVAAAAAAVAVLTGALINGNSCSRKRGKK